MLEVDNGEFSHVLIFTMCFIASASSSLSAYAFSTVDSGKPFEWRKACKYPFYFGCLGTFFCMWNFDWLGGKPKWYQVVATSGLIGLGVLSVEFITKIARGVVLSVAAAAGHKPDAGSD